MSNQTSDNNKRIAKNTLLLYVRMLFTMAVSLFTSRVILNTLGVEDYGINNVVGGIVTMFSVLSGSLSSSISRFITFELGKGNIEKAKDDFLYRCKYTAGNVCIDNHYCRSCWYLVLEYQDEYTN